MDPLVTGVEAAGVAAHGDDAGFGLHFEETFGIGQVVGDGDFDHDVFAGAHALFGLGGVQLGRRGEDGGSDAGLTEAFGEVVSPVGDVKTAGDLFGARGIPAGEAHHFNVGDLRDRFQVFDAEGALPGQTNLHEG